MGIKTLNLTETKIRIRLDFTSGNWWDQGDSTVILCLAFQLTFWITIRRNSNRKSMTNYYDKSVRYYIFFLVHFQVHKHFIGITLLHLLLEIPSSHEGWLQKKKWADQLIVISRIKFETMKKFIRFRVRLASMHFICYMHFYIHSRLLLPSLGNWWINFKKWSISSIYQPA